MKTEKGTVEIILPNTYEELSDHSKTLCELFIENLLTSAENQFRIEVDDKSRVVFSNDPNVRGALNVILRSGHLLAFYRQFVKLLHVENTGGALGVLRCFFKGQKIELNVEEKKGLPGFVWEIKKILGLGH